MEEKKTNVSTSDADQVSSFIKSLGGAKNIYSYLKTKKININIESIYKWKNNGIPHRYLLYIKELADNQDVIIPGNIFPENIRSVNNKADIISSIDNNIKGYRIPILIVLLAFIIVLLQFLYFQNDRKAVNEKILKLENLTLLFKTHDYDKKLDSINNFINDQIVLNKQYSSEIKNAYSLNIINTKKIKELEKNIGISFNNNNKIQNSKLSSFNTTLINLIVLKDNIKFSIPNLSNINLINDYFSRIKTPENITLALLNLNSLSKINLKSHVQLVEEITPLLIDLNKENSNKKVSNKINILTYLKNMIKISKISNTEFMYNNKITSNIINNLNSHNYDYILNEFKTVNNDVKLNEWLESINSLNILINSLDKIINWLIYKG
ncbi:MAG: hypothetical protein ACKVHD_01440 [Alphaproteobacteria bacterium]|jgi:hypothetical protein|tara:strand:+ start:2075 stop:3217 length:1143 start_codon:yes stop_codon:yes gene_type:complete